MGSFYWQAPRPRLSRWRDVEESRSGPRRNLLHALRWRENQRLLRRPRAVRTIATEPERLLSLCSSLSLRSLQEAEVLWTRTSPTLRWQRDFRCASPVLEFLAAMVQLSTR